MFLSSNLSHLAIGATLLLLIYKFLLHPLFISPLSRIPSAHPLASITPLWILWKRYTTQEIRTIHSAHQSLGPIIKLSPNEISVNCLKGGISTVYSGGFEKGFWYDFFTNYGGVVNMFSDRYSKSHSTRKRMISNIYSKSHLHSSPTLTEVTKELLFNRLLPKLDKYATERRAFNIYPELSGMTMDFVTGYQFGLAASSNLIQDDEFRNHFLDLYDSRRSYNFWPQELPGFTSFLARLGWKLVPDWVGEANKGIEEWTLKMCDDASSFLSSQKATRVEDVPASEAKNFPAVYSQLLSGMAKSKTPSPSTTNTNNDQDRLEIASELLDHLAAGFDTSGITLLYTIHNLSLHTKIQTTLRSELQTLSPPISLSTPTTPSTPLAFPKTIDALPFLDAIIQESLRLHAAIPGPEPRVTPASGCTLGPDNEFLGIPGGVRISAQAWSLHRNGEVYEDPLEWRPSRWIEASEEKLKEMKRWFWAFGSGGRMCVGSNLALYQMKYIIAAIYTDFKTIIVDDAGVEQIDLYTAPPKSGKLIIRLEHAGA
ncbi:cytochrome P450 [Venturia nashicola]|uniref:Cytochrome P450 n=1 Tax=Venturia nashicola TaxID=86259 RepID=A0A4Z1NVI5_9PEZI|nr:cytochrome P450 [Venturia nashicola]TLD21758.1 cytochrome P450 [Venturia nashicola]